MSPPPSPSPSPSPSPPPPPPPLRHRHPTTTLLLLSLLHVTTNATTQPPHPDLPPLLSFKSNSDPSNNLISWTNSPNPCNHTTPFYGVSCLHNRVTGLVLNHLNLHHRFNSLTSLVKLRILSLKHNHLTGPIPNNLSNLTSLKLLFLSHNHLSGHLPPSLPSLFRLDLSHNNFSGNVPSTVNRLTNLLTLRLENNHINGYIDFLNLPNLHDFNISMNNITGKIPVTLATFPVSVFFNNSGLCGLPGLECARPDIPSSPVVSSTPTSLPSTAVFDKNNNHGNGKNKIGTLAIVAIIIGDVLVLALVSLLLYCYFSGKKVERTNNNVVKKSEKSVYPSSTGSSFEKGRMVFFEGTRRFELEDLLRASAEMLGKGGLGTAYKAVLDDGDVVAVKRLKEVAVGGRREFEQQMDVLGRLRHPNVVSLKAYYFAKDEKLLVYEYMTNGNLFWLLHGNRGPGRTPLDWSTRLRIAAGAARGLTFIHTFNPSLKLTHGNIKSTNILLDKSGNACVSDLGHSAITPSIAAPRSVGYRAPELLSANNRKSTQKSDVYSFGVLLMEILTGKCPSMDNSGLIDLPRWVRSVVREEWTAELFDLELMRYKDIEEELVGLLQIALSCTVDAPEQRPTMEYVVKMIHDIEGVKVPPSRDAADSASNSP